MSYLVASVLPKSRGNVVDLGICYVGSTLEVIAMCRNRLVGRNKYGRIVILFGGEDYNTVQAGNLRTSNLILP